MPIILRFSPLPTDSTAFVNAAQVLVNGSPANGAWYWEQPTADDVKGHVVEAHYRRATYWPANAKIEVSLPIGGLSAGKGLVYDDKLTSVTFHTGDAHVSTVNGSTLRMTITDNGKRVAPPGETSMKVSLGAPGTPTFLGTKIVMQKGEDDPATGKLRPDGTVRMIGTGADRYDLLVKWSVRITRSGEYVHAAPWNEHLGQYSSSNGCTNLSTGDAKWYYAFSRIGDVVRYVNVPHNGGTLPVWDGYGDWNLPWSQWRAGGLLHGSA
jgi:lipoprotein-anchoring transpeptidase ErfK/SrfK